MRRRVIAFAYGILCYVLFLASFLYAVGFMGNFMVPKSIDSGTPGPVGPAIAINLLLIGLFAVHHTVAARPAFKQWFTRFVPAPVERSTYVLLSSLLFGLIFWQWRPIPHVVWEVEHPTARLVLWIVFGLGWTAVPLVSFVINHFDLFGLRQVYLHLRGREYVHAPFVTPALYRLIRHPLMVGWFVAFWVTPVMTAGHLLFAVANTAYILIGITYEERTLARFLGEPYLRYREQTPMFLPWPRPKPAVAANDGLTPPADTSAAGPAASN